MKKTDYGNWIPKRMMGIGWSITVIVGISLLLSHFLLHSRIISAVLLILFLPMLLMCIYMQICRHSFSFEGGGVMKRIHQYLISKLDWDGNGALLDIGCGSGALGIRCGRLFPQARITGIDYWSAEWSYAKEQCEENARLEQVSGIQFQQGDAGNLPFADESFDAAVSNFVFHEVKSQPDKREVVREALRIVKKGGCFAFQDMFEQKQLYGDIEEFIRLLKAEGVSEIHYEGHTERLSIIPWFVKAPWLLSNMGILYGRK